MRSPTDPKANLTFFCAVLAVQIFFFVSIANGQTINTFYNPVICQSIQSAVKRLPANTDAMKWPRALRVPSVTFPPWTNLDPVQSLKFIEENYNTEQTEYIDSEMKSSDPRVRKDLLPSAEAIDSGWNKFVKPRYLDAIVAKKLEFQQTSLVGLNGQKNNIQIFRFRVFPPKKIDIQIRPTPIDGLYDWEYLVRIYGQGNAYKDYPIASPPNPIQGEMAIVDNSIVIFLTAELTDTGLVEVYLPPGPVWWSGSGLATSDACILNFLNKG